MRGHAKNRFLPPHHRLRRSFSPRRSLWHILQSIPMSQRTITRYIILDYKCARQKSRALVLATVIDQSSRFPAMRKAPPVQGRRSKGAVIIRGGCQLKRQLAEEIPTSAADFFQHEHLVWRQRDAARAALARQKVGIRPREGERARSALRFERDDALRPAAARDERDV